MDQRLLHHHQAAVLAILIPCLKIPHLSLEKGNPVLRALAAVSLRHPVELALGLREFCCRALLP
jgi:hypothetical protein